MKTLTHSDLVKKAVAWLKSAKQCNPVFAERGSQMISEMPDAIGFGPHSTVVVECKVSMSDLQVDAKKPHRLDGTAMGTQRYYLMPGYLYYKKCRDHDFGGWGVLICDDTHPAQQVRGMKSADFESNTKSERDFLRSRVLEVQRFGQ